MTFDNATRQSILSQPAIPFNGANTVSQFQLPQTGLLSDIVTMVSIIFTTGATGTFANIAAPVPSPYNILSRIRLYTQDGAELYNTSGWGNYILQQGLRTGADVRNPPVTFGSSTVASEVYNIPATYAASTQYEILFPIVIPVALNKSLQAGLVLLQNQTTRVQMELTFGDIAASMLAFTGGGTITVNSVTLKPSIEVFNVPAVPADWPSLDYVMLTREDVQPIAGTGTFRYRMEPGNVYRRIFQEFTNNAAPMVSPINNIKLFYAQTQQINNVDRRNFLLRSFYQFGRHMPAGVFAHMLDFGTGHLEVASLRDAIDSSAITDLFIETEIAGGTTLVNAQCRTIRCMLASTA